MSNFVLQLFEQVDINKRESLCRSSVCIHFSRLSINFWRAISHHAACCHVISVIVRNEIIEMFPSSSLHQHISRLFFFILHARCYFDWDFVEANERNICFGVHMLIGLFISQAVGRPSVRHFASLDIFRDVECFMHFFGLFYLFIYLFILFFLSLVCFYRHDATIHK